MLAQCDECCNRCTNNIRQDRCTPTLLEKAVQRWTGLQRIEQVSSARKKFQDGGINVWKGAENVHGAFNTVVQGFWN